MATKLFVLLVLLFHVSSSLSEKCHPDDKRVLLQIKKELNNPTIFSSWKPKTDCCKKWRGVFCSRSINYRVFDLTILNDTELTAQFPASIGNLPYLETLYMEQLPKLTGPIPTEPIYKLTNLKNLIIRETGLSGSIPDFKAPYLKNLINLDISNNNKLSGTLPPSLYQLPKLSGTVSFQNNNLIGPIPSSYGYFNTSDAPALLFSHNQLSGRLPMFLANLNSPVIDFSYNRLEGDASVLFGSNKQGVLQLYLSWNNFDFDLGRIELPKKLQILDVSHNQIYGNLPVGIENVLTLNVSYNNLCGEIPQGGNLKSFDVSSFFHNKCLCGSPLPSCKK
ncbi:Leucine-rich repeat-containing N-terminal, plant-type [Sesbania bispinosa]|nr:Leucine-rich repeat-containing N-terminal, plant-type [Sesbania bispinosa]